ncbi:MAG: PhoX family phosphatase [Burkholderiaceae bacterium]|nr:PhoX family phosphatase [Burkholderiaceae bacterium]
MEDSNRSANPSIHQISDPARRQWLQGGLGLAFASAFAPLAAPLAGCATAPAGPKLGFRSVPASLADQVQVPEGYVAQVLTAWGDPVGLASGMPAFKPDASNSAAEQALQQGMHHDGMQYFALAEGQAGSRRGLLATNHEYVDNGLLFPDGQRTWSAEKVAKAQASHGISVIEVARQADGAWQVQRPSAQARRITGRTPFEVRGPAAGHALMRTAADAAGRTVLGTIANCAASGTPWGTLLSGEENWAGYFDGPERADADQQRWGLRRKGWSGWAEHDERFDAGRHPNEFHRFGWVVEIDPYDPQSVPVKRTALGRAAHEGATTTLTRDGRAVVYSGEDARFEYIYKFVSRERMRQPAPGQTAGQANRGLLDEGTLYVARFDADGRGRWLPLVHGQGPLTAANGFADQGAVVIRARQASDLLGATKMDRPEWLAVDPATRDVYCTLTNNRDRGADGFAGPDAANPRARNVMGQIIRWREDGDHDGEAFRWDHLLLAGDPANQRPEARGNVRGDPFACPDGLLMDGRGVLWICTDHASSERGQGEFARLGNNQMLACDVATGEVRRFLVGPANAEITGPTITPDGRTLFVNVQHPGEPVGDRSDPARPERFSSWPGGPGSGRPRSATLAIRRLDGGVVGG